MHDIFFASPGWVDAMGAIVVLTVLLACEGLVVLVCGWSLLKVAFLMYENLRQHAQRIRFA